tara:strand:+ start:505 stop:723 length:219 start_codon:yes stop_codon:yes gene_type:complete
MIYKAMSQAKDKAKELVEIYQFNGDMIDDIRMSEESAIECALICVDEMLQEIEDFPYPYKFWKEVKQEIHKL